MKKVEITKIDMLNTDSLFKWYTKHGLILNSTVLYDCAVVSDEDDTVLAESLNLFAYLKYSPMVDSSLNKGEALVFEEDEIKRYLKRKKLLDF